MFVFTYVHTPFFLAGAGDTTKSCASFACPRRSLRFCARSGRNGGVQPPSKHATSPHSGRSSVQNPPRGKSTHLSTDKSGFFELSVPLVRNVKYASQVKRTSCVKCAFGTICGTLNFTAPKEQLHCDVRHNFTAACRNFTFYIQGLRLDLLVEVWYNLPIGK